MPLAYGVGSEHWGADGFTRVCNSRESLMTRKINSLALALTGLIICFGEPFWSVFVVLGALALILSLILRASLGRPVTE